MSSVCSRNQNEIYRNERKKHPKETKKKVPARRNLIEVNGEEGSKREREREKKKMDKNKRLTKWDKRLSVVIGRW